jgi:hypothetical protein
MHADSGERTGWRLPNEWPHTPGLVRHSADECVSDLPKSGSAGHVGFDGEQVIEDLALVVAVHGAICGRVEHTLALFRRHVAEHAVGAAHLLLALRIHVAQLLYRAAHGLTPLRAEPLHVFIAAHPALPLLRRHGVQLMEPINEALLLLLREGVESPLAAKRVFLAGKRLTLMALKPGAEMRTAYVSRRRIVWASRGIVWSARGAGIRDAGTVRRTRNIGAGHG